MPDETAPAAEEREFLRWFAERGAVLSPSVALASFAGMGRGMQALEALPEDALLFAVPRAMLLGTRTSALPRLALAEDARRRGDGMDIDDDEAQPGTWQHLHRQGWAQLLLVMLWERFRASERGQAACAAFDAGADWGAYFGILPKHFDTPMFWSDAELAELKGTAIVEKIGKEEAHETYEKDIFPYIQSHAALFLGSLAAEQPDAVPALLQEFYSEPLFHMMASAVLSRSFHVRKPEPGQQPGAEGAEGMVRPGDRGVELAAPADEDEEGENGDESELHIDSDSDSDADADEAENIDDVCMVPMADMLNARFETDNARVFYHLDKLEMRTTRAIEKGEQLWNTYGDPPNCDLARRYGHVDEPNGADVVELPILRVVDAILALEGAADQAERRTSLLSRVEWSVAEGLDEVHALTYLFAPSSEPPHAPEPAKASSSELRAAAASVAEELLVHTRLLLLDDAAYEKVQAKGKLPNARIEAREPAAGKTLGVAEVLLKAIDLRLAEYPTSEQEDSARLYGAAGQQAEQGMSANLRAALVVRLGEKRILIDNARVLTAAHEASLKIAAAPAKGSKRKGAETAGASKKARK